MLDSRPDGAGTAPWRVGPDDDRKRSTAMPDVELERTQALSREEAGRRLIAVGEALVKGARSELELDGDRISFFVADQVNWEFELEVDGPETELEIELRWRHAPAS
jgi:amphi-Trp domain-containing protein